MVCIYSIVLFLLFWQLRLKALYIMLSIHMQALIRSHCGGGKLPLTTVALGQTDGETMLMASPTTAKHTTTIIRCLQ